MQFCKLKSTTKQLLNNTLMIKKSIFTLMMMTVMGWVSAQSLQFEWNGNVYSDGETIVCDTPNDWGEYLQDMQLRNLTGQDMKVLVEKEVIDDLEGVINYFCWGLCFSPDIIVSPDAVEVTANNVTEEGALSFHAMFDETVFGKVKVKYYAYEERNPDQKVSIVVVFHRSGAGIGDNAHSMTFGTAYPNPASSQVNFDYSLDGSLCAVVYNLLGQEVMREQLNANIGRMTLSVADLQEGIYFCTMMVDGRAWSTQKFVVKK